METMVTSLFLVGWEVAPIIDAQIEKLRRPARGTGRADHGTGPGTKGYALQQLECLRLLITQYVLALLLMGKMVRDCHWEKHAAGTRGHVRVLMQLQVLFLLALRPKQGRRQYLKTTLLGLS